MSSQALQPNRVIVVLGGAGRVAFVTGDAGSGKTSLLQEFIGPGRHKGGA